MAKRKDSNISKIANSKENLKEFLDRFARDNYKYASLQFTIYDYELFENCRENGDPAPKYTKIYRDIVSDYLNGGDPEELFKDWKELRSGIVAQMEAITAFTDSFTIYEYLINRTELKFTGDKTAETDPIDDEDTTRSLLTRIFSDKDNNAINLKLQTILNQLPVRITTDKFFNILEESLKLYINGEKSSAEKLKYMVRSAAGLYKPDAREDFTDLLEAEDTLENITFKDITEDDFNTAAELVQTVTTELTELSEHYGQLQAAVNQFGIMLVTRPYVDEVTLEEAERTKPLTKWIADNADAKEAVPDDLVTLFKTGEGKLEELSEALQRLAGMMEQLMDSNMKSIKELGLEEMAEAIEKCSVLSSDSIYADPDEEDDGAIADEAYVDQLTKELEGEFKALFEGREPKKRRAVMAAVLGELPVFFPSKTAVMDYISNSLKNCRDYAEKRTSIDLINSAFDELEGV